MTKITKPMISALRADIDAALAAVAQKHGLAKLATGSARYTDSTVTFQVEAIVAGGLTLEQQRYVQFAPGLGLPERGATFTGAGRTYTLDGMKSSGSVLATRDDGKTFRFQLDAVLGALALQQRITQSTDSARRQANG